MSDPHAYNGEFVYFVVASGTGDFPVPPRTRVLAVFADSDAALSCAQQVMRRQDPQNPLAWQTCKVSPMRLNEPPPELQESRP